MKHNHTRRAKRKRTGAKPALPRFLFLSDEERVKDPIKTISNLPHGCGMIIRDYNNPKRKELINQAKKLTKNSGNVLFIASVGLGGAGTHEHWPRAGLGQHRKKSKFQLITVSAHNLSEVGRANRLNADGLLLSPLFKTKSHKDAEALNIHRFVRLAHLAKPKVYALGGVDEKSQKQLFDKMPCYGIAGIGLFLNNKN